MATSHISGTGIARSRIGLRGDRLTSISEAISPILEECEFLRILCFERKRAERSGRPFMLMVISGEERFAARGGARVVRGIQNAISRSTRETDALGWYESRKKLAVLFTEIGCFSAADLIVPKVRAALQDELETQAFQAIHISFSLFPESRSRDDEHPDQVDLIFYPDLLGRHTRNGAPYLMKRALDVLGSMLLLALFSPVLLIVALLVKLTSPGPILFRQARIGQYGKHFTFLKFRSMYRDNNSAIHQEYVARLIEGKGNLGQDDSRGSQVYKLTADPRITPLGRFLRKTSLDELPQLVNVLFGEMSLVGPRPPVPYEFERYDLWHRRRIVEVKPGITGLWQVVGRSKTTFDDMVRLDLEYAKTWSVWMDLKILWRTPLAVIRADGAY